MSENPNSPAAIEASLQGVFALLAKGAFIEAMETYLADDVVLQESNDSEKHGKALCIETEKTILEDDMGVLSGATRSQELTTL